MFSNAYRVPFKIAASLSIPKPLRRGDDEASYS
jgi:hypothetical protein